MKYESELENTLRETERHIVGLYRGMNPFGNYEKDGQVENRFADLDQQVKKIREILQG